MFQFAVLVCGFHFISTQLCCQAMELNMMPNSFDDQYIGCEEDMEQVAPKLLAAERRNNAQLNDKWSQAAEKWSKKKPNLTLPARFKDEYGLAVVLYTMGGSIPIYQQLNGNISIRGTSREDFMENFHFKALHFYLTRALQLLRKGCAKNFTTYRGTDLVYTQVSEEIRFGQFASTSQNKHIAEVFGTGTFFTISTCFGADINDLSVLPEQEVLIPVAETFRNIGKSGNNSYTLESTGRLCSYFNCAYIRRAEKSEAPLYNSGTAMSSGSRLFSFFGLILNFGLILPP